MSTQPIQSNGKILRGALLGCGDVSKYHLRAWSQFEGIKIVALANRTISKAEMRAQEFGISIDHVYSSHLDLLNNEDIDFVDIATKPDIHRTQVEDAAVRGINVLCQKPMAPNVEDARAMIDACNQAGVLFSINENWRWRIWYREIKQLIDQGVVGKPQYFRFMRHANHTVPTQNGKMPRMFVNQPYMKSMDRLILYEWGIHLIDVLRFFFGEVNWVFARMDRSSPVCRGEDRALLTLDVGGVACIIDISWGSFGIEKRFSQMEHVTLEGESGSIELLTDEQDILRISTNHGVVTRPAFNCTPDEAYQASYTAAQSHFIDCLRGNLESETEGRDNIKTLQATLAAYESASLNNIIVLEKHA